MKWNNIDMNNTQHLLDSGAPSTSSSTNDETSPQSLLEANSPYNSNIKALMAVGKMMADQLANSQMSSQSQLLNKIAIKIEATNDDRSDPSSVSNNNANFGSPMSDGDDRNGPRFCVVCGDVAFGNHYGAVCCNGCKGFFRRSVWSKRMYMCRFGHDCEIRKDTRNVCRACRLRRCFQLGMNPEAVQMEDARNGVADPQCNEWIAKMRATYTNLDVSTRIHKEKERIRTADSVTQTNITANHFGQPKHRVGCDPTKILDTPKAEFIREDFRNLIIRTVFLEQETWQKTESGVKARPSGSQISTFEEAFNSPELVCARYPLNFNGENVMKVGDLLDGWRRHFTFYIDFCKCMPEFRNLPPSDQIALAKRRVVNMIWLMHAYYTSLTDKIGFCSSNGVYHPAEHDLRYDEADETIKTFYANLLPFFVSDMIIPMRQLKMDLVEYVLIKMITFFRDEFFVSNETRKKLEDYKQRYTLALDAYIKSKYDDHYEALDRFANLLNIIHSVLYLTSKMNERVELSSFFNIIDFDKLTKEIHATELFYNLDDPNNIPVTPAAPIVPRNIDPSAYENPDFLATSNVARIKYEH
ncbi:unnamed protein product [Bursaphelenchus okinawaensis]|uniref:Nuclear receptor domain-containing protein n=1 Tax=Bursaphelenchus okinawaensis TaxID=465554 RepID=A0A811L3D0_9BILA|nr:unnamed protein product [Bursaphelenchus okinawaensis]CAG9115270.1 unnamed protein product [Bursaphelenchus okinawaensis]